MSVQVLQEFYVQATRADKVERLSHEQAVRLIESFLRFPVQETSLPLLRAALDAKERFQMSCWDAAIVEAARLLGCQVVLSEDLSHGQDYAGVRVENPFL
jgi:predicted nucleic acid-binding protein